MTQLDGKSMFVSKAQPESMKVNGRAAHPKHKQIMFADEREGKNMSEYQFGAIQSGSQGTLVPVCTIKGGIQGSDNPYGKVVVGKVITAGPTEQGEVVKGDFIPTHILDRSTLPKAMQNNRSSLSNQIDEILGAEEAPATHIAKEALFSIGPDSDTEDIPEEVCEDDTYEEPELLKPSSLSYDVPLPQPTAAPAPVSPAKRVVMEGKFGKCRGKYTHVCIDSSFIVLMYDMDASVYTPPASDEVFTLSCENKDYDVYFAGIEFELPFMNSGVQVMVRTT